MSKENTEYNNNNRVPKSMTLFFKVITQHNYQLIQKKNIDGTINDDQK